METIESIKDILGQEIKVGDIVIYPKMSYRMPELTFAKVVCLKEKIDYSDRKNLIVQIKALYEESWNGLKEYPESKGIIKLYKATLTRHADNLVKVDPKMLTELEYDVLVNEVEVPVYYGYETKGKQYNKEDIKKFARNYRYENNNKTKGDNNL